MNLLIGAIQKIVDNNDNESRDRFDWASINEAIKDKNYELATIRFNNMDTYSRDLIDAARVDNIVKLQAAHALGIGWVF